MSEVTPDTLHHWLLPARKGVEHLPRVTITEEQVLELSHGRFIPGVLPEGSDVAAALDQTGRLVALLTLRSEGWLKPLRYFAD